ncbi:hypothetical protein BCR33DRAFT_851734 [Rhizoclosmatium globosum]|uniref:L domain-like protein n=1 Tax=Rhizoclosmatium globosum TaxID=329046 RepID=A0A1Y2C5P0_9FUNG|nr:hypothetical protein BCR33DRAFT_851734 [Rhizoclosmatium globosum]|eukprot:ORY42197.1 hypothetical protein BCR33DRAFT_851734 [Rhizoclosmatium globosum]
MSYFAAVKSVYIASTQRDDTDSTSSIVPTSSLSTPTPTPTWVWLPTPMPTPTPQATECEIIHYGWPNYPSSGTDCCIEPSIICVNGHVTRIEFGKGYKSGQLPFGLAALRWLTYISLNQNSLVGTIPTLPPYLQYLDLGSNELVGYIPRLPTTLTFIQLSANKLIGLLDMIPPLINLQFIDVHDNKLSGRIPNLPMTVTSNPQWGGYAASFNGNFNTPGSNNPGTLSVTRTFTVVILPVTTAIDSVILPLPTTSIDILIPPITSTASISLATDTAVIPTTSTKPRPPGPPTPPIPEPAPTNTTVIVGGVAGGIVALVLIVVIGIHQTKQKESNTLNEPEFEQLPTPENDKSMSPHAYAMPPMIDLTPDSDVPVIAQSLPWETEGARKPLPGRIWGTR